MSKKAFSLGVESLENKRLLSVTINDPRAISQWGLGSISTYQAWQYSTGSKGIVVAIIDSGIDLTHQDLINNLWVNPGEVPGDGIDNEGNGYVDDINGWNFYSNNNDVQDRSGHGTHIAGIIGAEGNNGVGVAGINWNVSLMALKFTDDMGMGYAGTAVQAMDYINMMKNTYGINVVAANASWGGGTGFSNALYEAIGRLNDAGVVLTVAAGNNGSDTDVVLRYPSCFDIPNVISVGALSSYTNDLAIFSNYGATTVDIAAPGAGVLSTIPYNNYGYKTGTSMAAPQVAGTVALLNAIKPNITINEVKNAIFSSVDKVPELFGKVATNGSLNTAAAICTVLNIPYDNNKLPIGAITNQTFTTVSGWAKDPNDTNSSIGVKLIIDGAEKGAGLTTQGYFSFNLGRLLIGNHIIEIKAQDSKTGTWHSIGSVTVNIPAPVGRVGLLNLNRVSGWAFSERSGSGPVVVRVLINNRLVTSQIAKQYRPTLIPLVGSANHGFNIVLNRHWFRRGMNEVTIQVLDPMSGQLSILWKGVIRK